MSIKGDVLAQYLGHGDPALADYYPAWLDNMADDATVEGCWTAPCRARRPSGQSWSPSARCMTARSTSSPAPAARTASSRTTSLRSAVVLVTRNDAGKTQHVVAGYRPRSSLLLLSRLLREKFAGTPYAEHFAARES